MCWLHGTDCNAGENLPMHTHTHTPPPALPCQQAGPGAPAHRLCCLRCSSTGDKGLHLALPRLLPPRTQGPQGPKPGCKPPVVRQHWRRCLGLLWHQPRHGAGAESSTPESLPPHTTLQPPFPCHCQQQQGNLEQGRPCRAEPGATARRRAGHPLGSLRHAAARHSLSLEA